MARFFIAKTMMVAAMIKTITATRRVLTTELSLVFCMGCASGEVSGGGVSEIGLVEGLSVLGGVPRIPVGWLYSIFPVSAQTPTCHPVMVELG